MNNRFFHFAITFVLVLLLFLGSLAIFGRVLFQSSSEELTPFVVRLGWVDQAQFAGFYVADELGFYEDAGLDVQLLPLTEEMSQEEELDTGIVQASIMEAHQILAGINEGYDLLATAAIYQVNPHALAAREDSGIAGPEDFEGKVFGLAGGIGEGDSLFQVFVDQYTEEDVQFVHLGFDTIDDFKENRADVIDVYAVDQPYLAAQEGIDLVVISLDAYGLSTYGDVIAVSKTFADESPEIIRAFVQASMDGWRYAISNPSDAIDISYGRAEGSYKDKDYQEHILFNSITLIKGDLLLSDLGRMDLVPWSLLHESMREAGVLSQDLDIRNVFTNAFLD